MTISSDMELRWSRRLSVVPRWVVVPTIQSQNVAEHTFHVARTAMWILPRVLPAAEKDSCQWRLEVLEYAISHDDGEAAEGDRPSPSKKGRSYDELSPVEAIVKMADVMEAIAFIFEDTMMGNKRVDEIMEDLEQRFESIADVIVMRFPLSKNPWKILEEYIGVLNASHPGLEGA